MSFVDYTAYVVAAAGRRISSAFATRAARHSATVADSARFLAGGSVSNIARRRDRILVGEGCRIAGELLVFRGKGSIRIGEWCFLGANSRIWSASAVTIGDRVLISHNANIHDSDSHPLQPDARHRQFRQIAMSGHPEREDDIDARPVVIEDDVWIGFNCIVLKGSHIGARSVIAAGSIVTGTVPPDSVFIGTEVKRTFSGDYSRQ